jgi:hypothetical protein
LSLSVLCGSFRTVIAGQYRVVLAGCHRRICSRCRFASRQRKLRGNPVVYRSLCIHRDRHRICCQFLVRAGPSVHARVYVDLSRHQSSCDCAHWRPGRPGRTGARRVRIAAHAPACRAHVRMRRVGRCAPRPLGRCRFTIIRGTHRVLWHHCRRRGARNVITLSLAFRLRLSASRVGSRRPWK